MIFISDSQLDAWLQEDIQGGGYHHPRAGDRRTTR